MTLGHLLRVPVLDATAHVIGEFNKLAFRQHVIVVTVLTIYGRLEHLSCPVAFPKKSKIAQSEKVSDAALSVPLIGSVARIIAPLDDRSQNCAEPVVKARLHHSLMIAATRGEFGLMRLFSFVLVRIVRARWATVALALLSRIPTLASHDYAAFVGWRSFSAVIVRSGICSSVNPKYVMNRPRKSPPIFPSARAITVERCFLMRRPYEAHDLKPRRRRISALTSLRLNGFTKSLCIVALCSMIGTFNLTTDTCQVRS